MSKTYWFLETAEVLAKKLADHHGSWLGEQNTMAQNWVRNSAAYYSTILEASDWASSLGYRGDQGELIKMVVPQARSFIRQIVTLATKQRLYFKTIAENLDSDVLQDTRIANALCEQIVNDQRLDQKREYVVESSCVRGMAFYKVSWRSDKGTPYAGTVENTTDAEGNEFKTPIVHYDGDLEISTPSIADVYWDSRIVNWQDLNWVECRTIKNRWDMIASYPDIEDEIAKLPAIDDQYSMAGRERASSEDTEDLIYVYECYHKPSPALPKGRTIVYSDSDTIYYDGPNPYETIPIIPLKPEPIIDTGYGYPKLNDLLPAQEMFDTCLSAIATNNAATSVQSVLCPRDANIRVDQISGVNWIYYTPIAADGGGAPKPLQLTQSAPETFKFAEMLKGNMMELSGINSAVRGAPPPGVTSGTAIATLTANALEFMNSLSKADQLALEQVMWLSIMCYAKFAGVPRLVEMTGKGNQMIAKSFTGKDIASIKKVRILTSNPLMNTIGGRSDIAEKLLGSGLIKNPQQYFQVLEGAPPEIMYEEDLSQEDLIHRENEALMDGSQVIVLKTDDHAQHIRSHASLLNDPAVRLNNGHVAGILQHMQEHEDLARTVDPFLAAMIATGHMPQGGPPPPPGQAPGPGPGGPGGPGPGMPPPPGPGPGGPGGPPHLGPPPGIPTGPPMTMKAPAGVATPTPDLLHRA
jgi:hypothetical protein